MVSRGLVVAALGTSQTLAWASSYYLPAILAAPMAAAYGLAPSAVFALFSGALVLTAVLGPWAGRLIDRRGGRDILVWSNLVMALGLALMGLAPGFAVAVLAWALLGLGMAMGLYDAAFATLAGLYGKEARGAITGITLIAGFASTVGWPLTTLFAAEWGWRGACLAWAGLHLAIGLPLNRLLVPPAPPPAPRAATAAEGDAPPQRALLVLAYVFGVVGFISTAIGAHLPGLVLAAGGSAATALAAGALIGPSQVGARLVEFGLLRRLDPLVMTRLAAATHPLGALVLLLGGAALAPVTAMVFAVLHGAGNGMLTIARGTLPLALFGAAGYGARQGWITAPARLAAAVAPLGFGLLVEGWGAGALWVSAGLAASAVLALFWLQRGR
jgi:MFS family permease